MRDHKTHVRINLMNVNVTVEGGLESVLAFTKKILELFGMVQPESEVVARIHNVESAVGQATETLNTARLEGE